MLHLTEEKETLFITLIAKSNDYNSQHSILKDKKADEILNAVNIDVSKYRDLKSEIIVIRAKQMDDWVTDFIHNNNSALIIYLGCGLDSRILRINPEPTIDWIDIDYPEVIELRKNFFSDTDHYKMIASSVLELQWLQNLPNNRPTLIVAEGVFEYISETEVKNLIDGLLNYFKKGQIIFDIMNSFAIDSAKEKLKNTTGAIHKWVVDDLNQIDKLNSRLKRMECLPIFKSQYIRQLPAGKRFFLSLMSLSKKFRNMLQLVRYEFRT